jgi:hypothetical protein
MSPQPSPEPSGTVKWPVGFQQRWKQLPEPESKGCLILYESRID